MTILIAPNSFKGSLAATAAAEAIARGLRRSGLTTPLRAMPLADGGDGTLEAFLASGGTLHLAECQDALGRPVQAPWGLLADGTTAIIEMARASGLAMLAPAEVTPASALRASTFGTGQLICAALDAGAQRIILGLGGSATTDGGTGCLTALGARFLDAQGRDLPPGGAAMAELAAIDLSDFDPRARAVAWVIASDVQNPAVGHDGAAAVFGPQKGADSAAVAALERGLNRLFALVQEQHAIDMRALPGGGAAGAFAAGMVAFTGASITSGIDLLLDVNGFDAACASAALVITGEGQLDGQTLGGKAPFGVARRAARFGVPTIALVGGLHADEEALRAAGLAAAFPIVTHPMPLEDAMRNAAALLERAALRLGYVLQLPRLAGL